MSVPESIILNPPQKGGSATFSRWMAPEKVSGFAWVPFFMAISHLGVTFLRPSLLSPYIPFFVLTSAFAILRWHKLGLAASYLALIAGIWFFFPVLLQGAVLWQGGLLTSLALNNLILCLYQDEDKKIRQEAQHKNENKDRQLVQRELDLQALNQSFEEERKELEEEIEKIKAQAEQRNLEKGELAKKLLFIQEEIDYLTQQKNQWITETVEARALAYEKGTAYEELEQTLKTLQEVVEATNLQKQHLTEEVYNLRTRLEDREKALRGAQLIQEETQLALKVAIQEKEEIDLKAAEQILECRRLSEELGELEKMRRELARFEGLYKQLRLQFEDKTKTLSQTRKELFHLTGEWEKAKIAHSLEALEPNREEARLLEGELEEALQEVRELEEEIILLEELILHSHFR